jgi:hypothetical protein
MATTTAGFSISSSDLLTNPLAFSQQKTLTQAGITTGITGSTGLAAKTFASDSNVVLIDASTTFASGSGHEKVYIKNTSTSSTQYVQVLLGTIEIGRLYGGDWLFMPTCLGSDDFDDDGGGTDIEVTPSTSDSVTLEYMVLY